MSAKRNFVTIPSTLVFVGPDHKPGHAVRICHTSDLGTLMDVQFSKGPNELWRGVDIDFKLEEV